MKRPLPKTYPPPKMIPKVKINLLPRKKNLKIMKKKMKTNKANLTRMRSKLLKSRSLFTLKKIISL